MIILILGALVTLLYFSFPKMGIPPWLGPLVTLVGLLVLGVRRSPQWVDRQAPNQLDDSPNVAF
jgi:hypothetical protein